MKIHKSSALEKSSGKLRTTTSAPQTIEIVIESTTTISNVEENALQTELPTTEKAHPKDLTTENVEIITGKIVAEDEVIEGEAMPSAETLKMSYITKDSIQKLHTLLERIYGV